MKRVIVFIDGNNWYHNTKSILDSPSDIDFRKLSKLICSRFGWELVGINYYNAIPSFVSKSYEKHMRFINWLKMSNINVKIKSLSGCGKHVREKGVDMMIAVDMIRKTLVKRECDVCVLVSGDADFIPLMELMKETGFDVLSCSVLMGYSVDLRDGTSKFLILKKEDVLNCLR